MTIPQQLGVWDGPVYRIHAAGLDFAVVAGADTDLTTLDNVDIEVRLPDDTVWTATMFTYDEVGRLMQRWAESGDANDGGYFACADSVIVRSAGLHGMIRALADLFARGELTSILGRGDPD
ncbi:hypothetical protein ACEXQB_000495 [Herbiconiux sp. P18]|uniref:hypothetical protein n=1 Tax=Herbiconiux liangxiaofengii TaxID=3342795 RepID=UPI0035BB4160